MFLVGLLAVLSCDDDALPEGEFVVIVENTSDVACGLPVIRFLDNGKQVRKRTGHETMIYLARHLDSTLNVVDTKLVISFSEVAIEDIRVCNALGIMNPQISIVSARLAP